MAWSIFDYQNGDAVATAWAVELLAALNLQATPARLQFVFDWEKSEGGGGAYNPLNQGPVPNQPGLTTTGSQYGGGAADFASWEAGIQGAVDYLQMQNFQPVLAAMESDNYNAMTQALWNSSWAGSHYGYGAAWNTGNYVAMSPAQISQVAQSAGLTLSSGVLNSAGAPGGTPGTTTAATPATATGNTGSVPAPPPLTDPTAFNNYMNVYYPQFAWLLSVPGVNTIIDNLVESGTTSTAQIQAAIEGSEWWKTTSAAMRQYEQTQAQSPAELSFTTPGSQAQQILAQVMNTAATNGVTLSAEQAQLLATDFMKFGWSTQQLQAAIGTMVSYNGSSGNAMSVVDQLQAMAANYYQTPSSQALQSWAQNIAAGTQTIQQFQAQMQQDASLKWTGYAPQLKAGNNMVQLTDSLRSNIAQLMEVDPSSINFTSDPMYSKILDYVPPGQKDPVHRVMTQSEAMDYLRGTPQWSQTQNARDTGAQVEQAITQAFGKVGT